MGDHIGKIAKTCHEINRIYCESHGDMSQPVWDEAPYWQKKSARQGVVFLMANPKATPENSHESWLAVKKADGWSYGEKKDPDLKTHPCCIPYGELPEQQRHKDSLFNTIVRGMS